MLRLLITFIPFTLIILFLSLTEEPKETLSCEVFIQEVQSNKINEIVYVRYKSFDRINVRRIDGSTFITNCGTWLDIQMGEGEFIDFINQNNVSIRFEEEMMSYKIKGYELLILFILILFQFATWASYLASNRGQSKILWFFLTFIFLIAILFIAMKDKVKKD